MEFLNTPITVLHLLIALVVYALYWVLTAAKAIAQKEKMYQSLIDQVQGGNGPVTMAYSKPPDKKEVKGFSDK